MLTVEYEHALVRSTEKSYEAGLQRLTLNAVVSRHWKFTAPTWE